MVAVDMEEGIRSKGKNSAQTKINIVLDQSQLTAAQE